ncbi:hypothetical protein [Hydrogenophaga taeniospiralis]|nr:hypothetical protein [Hydrogenophaga taeniospiralis]
MKRYLIQVRRLGVAMAVVHLLCFQQAHGAPGEDTIVLKGPVKYAAMPTAPQQRSGGMDGPTDLPAWMRARVTRYVAKAYGLSGESDTIYTDEDVVTTVQTDGFKKTCVQEVGSNTQAADALGTRYGPDTREQVVVLRGDLVNVCR